MRESKNCGLQVFPKITIFKMLYKIYSTCTYWQLVTRDKHNNLKCNLFEIPKMQSFNQNLSYGRWIDMQADKTKTLCGIPSIPFFEDHTPFSSALPCPFTPHQRKRLRKRGVLHSTALPLFSNNVHWQQNFDRHFEPKALYIHVQYSGKFWQGF